MRNVSRTLAGTVVAGALVAGALGGVAVARGSAAPADVPYELLAAADSTTADSAALAEGKGDHPRLRLAARRSLIGVHGEVTVRAKGGGFGTYSWQRGAVTAAASGSLTVKSADGTSWTWTVTADTKVRKNGDKSTSAALATGDNVFVLGRPDGDARKALAVVVPKRAKG